MEGARTGGGGPRMGATGGDPRRDRWRFKSRSLLSSPRRRSPRGTKAAARRRGSAARHRPGGRRLPRPGLEPLGYSLLLISQGQDFAPLFLPCWVGSENGKGHALGSLLLGQPPSNAPPDRPAVGRPSAGWAVRRSRDPASLGSELPAPAFPSRFILPAPLSLSGQPVHYHGVQDRLQTHGLQT